MSSLGLEPGLGGSTSVAFTYNFKRFRERFSGREWDTFSDSDVPGSTKYVDPGTRLTRQNQDALRISEIIFMRMIAAVNGFLY